MNEINFYLNYLKLNRLDFFLLLDINTVPNIIHCKNYLYLMILVSGYLIGLSRKLSLLQIGGMCMCLNYYALMNYHEIFNSNMNCNEII